MDHELKQRLIGAVVVTALAAIFIPMLFDDPVDTSGKAVKGLSIPEVPAQTVPEVSQSLPENKAQVLNRSDIELDASEVIEEGPADANSKAPGTDVADGGQAQQGMADTSKSLGADIAEGKPIEGLAPNESDPTESSGLDTGVVQEAGQLDDSQNLTNETKIPPQKSIGTPTGQSVSKPAISEKTKAKPQASEKPKTADSARKDAAKQPHPKLVRYSIQAGSFNKRENAQALADKLRKQGMPTTIIAKGEYFRVKIGPALNKEKAKEMKAKLDKQNIKGLLISE